MPGIVGPDFLLRQFQTTRDFSHFMHFVVVQNEYDNFVVHIFFEISFFHPFRVFSSLSQILTNGRTEIMQRRDTFGISELPSELKSEF